MSVEVINDLLGYDGLKIIQRPDMFNFSLDSTLLADFATINKKTKKIIDLGTGNAPIPLFLSLRTTSKIIGVEIQETSYDLAVRSVELNQLSDQITIYHNDLKGIHKQLGNGEFDLVLCNPPFFKYQEDSNINKNDYLTIARHEVLVTLEEIIVEAKKLLMTGGYLAMVHRPQRLEDIIVLLHKHKFSIKRLQFVYPKNGKDAVSVLVEAKNNGNVGMNVLEPLYVYNENNDYTKELLKIFRYGEE